MSDRARNLTVFVFAALLGAVCTGGPFAASAIRLRTRAERAERERDAAWEMYRILADEKRVIEGP